MTPGRKSSYELDSTGNREAPQKYYEINGRIRCTATHPVLSRGKWVAVGCLKVGDVLTGADGRAVTVFAVTRVDMPAPVFNFHVSTGTYVAGGVIVHNKENCQQYIQYCIPCGQ